MSERSDHDTWLKSAETAVREEFPSLSEIDVARVVKVAVLVYERERCVKVAQRVNAMWRDIRLERGAGSISLDVDA